MKMDRAVVELQDLRFSWGGEHPLIALEHWQLEAGEQVLVSGPSGCGKSTLLALICGVLQPSAGTIRILDTRLADLGEAGRDRFRSDHVGVIFQQFNLIPYLSALDNMVLGCRLSSRRRKQFASSRQIARAACEIAAELDLDSSALGKPVTHLSIGQQQRVAAVRALLGEPELLLADEPTSALDPERERQFLALLAQRCRRQQTAVLMVSHRQELAVHFDRHWPFAAPLGSQSSVAPGHRRGKSED